MFQRIRILPAAAAICLSGAAVWAGDATASADAVRPLLVGAEVPSLTLRAADGSAFDLRAATGEQRSILVFYRGGW